MFKYLVLSFYLFCLTWQSFAEDSDAALPEDLGEGVHAFNGTSGNIETSPNYMQVKVNDKDYTFIFQNVNWYTAREKCTSINQVLASINSQDDTVAIINSLNRHGVFNSDSTFWIGASQLGHIGQWSSVNTGRSVFYTNWKNNEPIPYCDRHCVEILGDGHWNNNDCDLRRPFICESIPSCSR